MVTVSTVWCLVVGWFQNVALLQLLAFLNSVLSGFVLFYGFLELRVPFAVKPHQHLQHFPPNKHEQTEQTKKTIHLR